MGRRDLRVDRKNSGARRIHLTSCAARFSHFTPPHEAPVCRNPSGLTVRAEPVKSIVMVKTTKQPAKNVVSHRPVEQLIHVIRGQKVMLDRDLAALYEVPTKVLNIAGVPNLPGASGGAPYAQGLR